MTQIINPKLGHTSLSYFNTSPESPDAQQIAYVHWKQSPNANDFQAAELWVCDTNLKNHRMVIEPGLTGVHNGLCAQWVDNEHIVYLTGHGKKYAEGLGISAVHVPTGRRVWGPIQADLGHDPCDGHILGAVNPGSTAGKPGIYEIDGITGAMRLLLSITDLEQPVRQRDPKCEFLPIEEWSIMHLQYSTDASHILFRLDCLQKNESKLPPRLVTMKRNGSDIISFGSKPLHMMWYDDDTIMGHDKTEPNDRSCRRWDRHGNCIETLAPAGNHLAVSANRQLYVSENNYHERPVIMNLYFKGQTSPSIELLRSENSNVVWAGRNHVNPSFSRNDKRVYFNAPSNKDYCQAAFIVLPDLEQGMEGAERKNETAEEAFAKLAALPWKTRFSQGEENWQKNWHMDGKVATISQKGDVLDFKAGPENKNDAHHAVLWTNNSYAGSLRIDYEFTCTDEAVINVCILYIQATGSGEKGYAKDIFAWNDKREVPAMSTYFKNMNTYHISYAAYGTKNKDPKKDYLRARRYLAEGKEQLNGTEFPESYEETGFWASGVKHQITVIKHDGWMFMSVKNATQAKVYSWDLSKHPPLEEGRIGLRQMFTRSALYAGFRVATLAQ